MLLIATVRGDSKSALVINSAVLAAEQKPPHERDDLPDEEALARWRREYEVQMRHYGTVLKAALSRALGQDR